MNKFIKVTGINAEGTEFIEVIDTKQILFITKGNFPVRRSVEFIVKSFFGRRYETDTIVENVLMTRIRFNDAKGTDFYIKESIEELYQLIKEE